MCVCREEDSTYIQQEAILRQRYAVTDLLRGHTDEDLSPQSALASLVSGEYSGAASRVPYGSLKDDPATSSLHDPHGPCPSSWHTTPDRHSPVFPHQPGDVRREIRDRRKRALPEEGYPGYRSGGHYQGEAYYIQPSDAHAHYPQAAHPAHKRYCGSGYEGIPAARVGEIHPNCYESSEYVTYPNGYTQNGYLWEPGYGSHGHGPHNQPNYLTPTNITYTPIAYDVINGRPDTTSTWSGYEHSSAMASYTHNYYSKVSQGQIYLQDGHKAAPHVTSMSRADPQMTSHVTDVPHYAHIQAGSHVDPQSSCKQMVVLPHHGNGSNSVATKIQYIAL